LSEAAGIHELAAIRSITPGQANPILASAGTATITQSMKIGELARRQGVSLQELIAATGEATRFSADSLLSADLEIKYSGYFSRERAQAERMKTMGGFVIPSDVEFGSIRSLSFEARQKLAAIRPLTLAQASRIPGVSPSDIQNLVIEIERRHVRQAHSHS
jgi:tRNA uridine 5-carboxymethylaminomethyl modification enzyme